MPTKINIGALEKDMPPNPEWWELANSDENVNKPQKTPEQTTQSR